jgi:hypothetical protein
MELAFGQGVNVSSLQAAWAAGDFTMLPQIQVRSHSDINGAYGAYAAAIDIIFISEKFLSENAGNLDAIASVILEEIGHAVDGRLNQSDSLGDEGAIFSALVRGETLNPQQLGSLRAEDDTATVTLDGQVVEIEQNASQNGDFALLFDGTDDYVSIPHSSSLSLTDFTIETSVNPSQIKGDWQPLIYLSYEFLSQNQVNLGAIVALLLEEYGHYVDGVLNATDAPLLSNFSLDKNLTTVVFIDSSVANAETLRLGVRDGVEAIMLSPHQDGIGQITRFLQHNPQFKTIHIVSHGAPGCLYLGNGELNLGNIGDYGEMLRLWPENAHILLYGCQVAAGDAGEEFICQSPRRALLQPECQDASDCVQAIPVGPSV